MRLLVTFFSVSAALHAQKLLARQDVPCEVVPVPRSVSSSCGYAMDVPCGDADALAAAMDDAGVEWATLYRHVQDGKSEKYEPFRSCFPADGGSA